MPMKLPRRRLPIFLFFALALLIALVGFRVSSDTSAVKLLHTEPSMFGSVVVFEQYGERCMNFNEVENMGRQTCFQLNDPDKMVFAYTRMMASALLAKPEPSSILIIGLGGATLPVALHKLLPDTVIDTVEIDPAVVRVAQRFFSYETGPNQRVHVEDGRAFVEQAQRDGRQYDIVMLDAFDVDYIPAHLLTLEFLQQVRAILAPDGLVVANSFTRSHMYARESATYAAVFGDFFNLRSGLEGNRVIIASPAALPDEAVLERNADLLAARLRPFGIDTQWALARISTADGKEQSADVLRD